MAAGWRVATIWECSVRKGVKQEMLDEMIDFIKNNESSKATWPREHMTVRS